MFFKLLLKVFSVGECSENAPPKYVTGSVCLIVCKLQLQESQRMIQERTRRGEREMEEFQQSLESVKVRFAHTLAGLGWSPRLIKHD